MAPEETPCCRDYKILDVFCDIFVLLLFRNNKLWILTSLWKDRVFAIQREEERGNREEEIERKKCKTREEEV